MNPASGAAPPGERSVDQWRRLERIIDTALDAPRDQRERLISAQCADDLELRDAALVWLRACTEVGSALPLDVPLTMSTVRSALQAASDPPQSSGNAITSTASAAPTRCAGTLVGPWRLLHEIGRGGMGVVYLAERAQRDVEMLVALKFMRHIDALDAIGLRRFHDERHILASLAHPSIARLVDVGVDGDTPWLAMEYIAGVPIDVWCNAQSLSVDDRIALFCEVTDAVQHAHTRLVVHRDLKPANILVSKAGRPTLLDFGIAKLLDTGGMHAGGGAAGSERVHHFTRPGQQPMTPAYASPEQKRGDAPSTAGDVYALGVLLHELLTGELPHTGVLPSDAAQHQGQSARHARRMRGDLDTIIARAIDDDPLRRYATAEALAADLRRYVRGLPVLARRESTIYRFRKWVARHPRAFAAATVAVGVAVAFTMFTAQQSTLLRGQAAVLREQASTLRVERDKAVEVTAFLKNVLSSADPYQPGAAVPTLREVLDRATADIERRLQDRPAIRAQLYSAIAPAYFGLGEWTRAGDAAAAAVSLRRSTALPHDPELAASLVYLASVRLNQLRAVEAEGHAREALSIIRAIGTSTRDDSLSALSALGSALQKQGRRREAGAVLAEVLQVEQARVPSLPARLAQFERNLAHVLRDDRRYSEAITLYASAYAHHVEAFGTEHPESANSAVNLGYAYFLSDRVSEALPLLRDGVLTKRRLLGLMHQDVAGDQLTYARVLDRIGRTTEATRLRVEAESVLVQLTKR